MGGKRKVSVDGSGKATKSGEPKLPSIPADSTKLPHMKLFNEWLTLSFIEVLFNQKNLATFHKLVKRNLNSKYDFGCVAFMLYLREGLIDVHGAFDLYLAKILATKESFCRPA